MESSFSLNGTFCQESVPKIFHWLSCIQNNNFFPLVVHTRMKCLSLNEEQPILWGLLRAKLILGSFGTPKWVNPQWTNTKCSSVKPPLYYLTSEHGPKNSLNMEEIVCKTTKLDSGRTHRTPDVSEFSTFHEVDLCECKMFLRRQRSKTYNIWVKCSNQKSWLTHEHEKPIRLSPIASPDFWQGR